MMMKESSQRLKVDHDQYVHEHDGGHESDSNPLNEAFIV